MFDLANPIKWDHHLAKGLQFFGLALPGMTGGAKLWNLCDQHYAPGRHGTLSGMGIPYASGASGWQHTANPGHWDELRCNGGSENVGIANTPSLKLVTNFSVVFNFLYRAQQNGTIVSMGDAGASSTGSNTSMMRLFQSDIIVTQLGSNILQASLTLRRWTHVALVCNTSGSILYYDGQKKATGAALNTWWNYSGPIRIGRAEGTYFSASEVAYLGSLDGMMLYNRPLSAQEVLMLYWESQQTFPSIVRRIGGSGIQLGQLAQSAFYANWRRRAA